METLKCLEHLLKKQNILVIATIGEQREVNDKSIRISVIKLNRYVG